MLRQFTTQAHRQVFDYRSQGSFPYLLVALVGFLRLKNALLSVIRR